MKRMIKSSLTILLLVNIFLAWPEKTPVLRVAAAEETVDNDIAIEEVTLKVEVYLSEYFKEFPADDLESEKNNPKEYLTEKLQADDFIEEEIDEIFEVMAEKRQEELKELIEIYLEEEPYISKNALISILTESGYSKKEIEQVLELVDMDWKEQAVKVSEEYINIKVEIDDESYEIISRRSLFQFLVEVKDFTMEEVAYGIEESAIDWDEQAFKQAKHYLAVDAYSKKSLIKKLITDGIYKRRGRIWG